MGGKKLGQINLFTRRVSRLPPAPEFHTHVMVADLLRGFADPNWRWTHLPMGEYRAPATAARLKRMGARAGFADFLLVSPSGHAFFLELKRARRGRLNEAQEEFASWCALHQIPFAIARNFDEALGRLKAWGAVPSKVKVSA